MARQKRQGGLTMEEFYNQYGYMPATVSGHEKKSDGMKLITIDDDPDTDIEIYDDDRTPHRTGEMPEWAE